MKELFRLAEGHETGAALGVASGAHVFESAMRQVPVVAELFRRGLLEAVDRQQIARRACELLRKDVDLRYRHPDDIPIAVYLWVLDAIDRFLPLEQRLSPIASAAVMEFGHNLCWADRVARAIQFASGLDRDSTDRSIGETNSSISAPQASLIQLQLLATGVFSGATSAEWTFQLPKPSGFSRHTIPLPSETAISLVSDSDAVSLAA